MPTWSPGGDTLAFVRDGKLHLLALASGATFLISGVPPVFSPEWSPVDGVIAFDTNWDHPGEGNVIWTLRTDGTEFTDISQHRVGEWRAPAWTPDGDSLVHYRYVTGVSGSELFIMAGDGSGGRRLTFDDASDGDPTCSPDGGTIAWTRNARGGAFGIYALNRATGASRRLFTNASDAAWSPASDSLVFAQWVGDRQTLWIGDAQGVSKRPLTDQRRRAPTRRGRGVAPRPWRSPQASLHQNHRRARCSIRRADPGEVDAAPDATRPGRSGPCHLVLARRPDVVDERRQTPAGDVVYVQLHVPRRFQPVAKQRAARARPRDEPHPGAVSA
jgi:hypothetical protein